MPIPTPPARYDLPWKAVLSHAFRDFMVFFFPDISASINWSVRPRFRDKELAGIGFDAGVMVADKLVEVSLCDGSVKVVLIHIEVQSQRDVELVQRIFDYNYRIGKEYGLPVMSLVLLADEHPAWRPWGFRTRLPSTEASFIFATAKLLDFAPHVEALEASHNPVALLALAHLLTQQACHDADKLYTSKLHLTRLLFQHRWSKRRIILLFKALNWMMVLPDAYQQRYWQTIRYLDKELNMKIMEWVTPLEQMFIDQGWKRGMEQGLEQGIEQGIEQGRKEGAAALLARQLERRFGALPKNTSKKLAKASLAQVEAWGDALLTAQSLRQVWQRKIQ